ncbi:hypothetical protein ACOSQ3_006520 [Xanthoceras sorbifolium]
MVVSVVSNDMHEASGFRDDQEVVFHNIHLEGVEVEDKGIDEGCAPFKFSAQATNLVTINPYSGVLSHNRDILHVEKVGGLKRGH